VFLFKAIQRVSKRFKAIQRVSKRFKAIQSDSKLFKGLGEKIIFFFRELASALPDPFYRSSQVQPSQG